MSIHIGDLEDKKLREVKREKKNSKEKLAWTLPFMLTFIYSLTHSFLFGWLFRICQPGWSSIHQRWWWIFCSYIRSRFKFNTWSTDQFLFIYLVLFCFLFVLFMDKYYLQRDPALSLFFFFLIFILNYSHWILYLRSLSCHASTISNDEGAWIISIVSERHCLYFTHKIANLFLAIMSISFHLLWLGELKLLCFQLFYLLFIYNKITLPHLIFILFMVLPIFCISMCGNLMKKSSGSTHRWVKRYFVLQGSTLVCNLICLDTKIWLTGTLKKERKCIEESRCIIFFFFFSKL